MSQTAFISHPRCIEHHNNPDHPEQPDRLRAILKRLSNDPIWDTLSRLDAQPATKAQLSAVHEHAYIEQIFAQSPSTGLVQLDEDTWMNPYTLEAALLAAGSVVQAVDEVIKGHVKNAFCAVRPPGHHAERGRAMGFCVFNNVAVGVHHALAQYGFERIAVVDFDVHHGNGTEDIFTDDERVLLCSSFQHPFYPFSGADNNDAHISNIPLHAGTGSSEYHQAVTAWFERIRAFDPDMIFISAGFDAHKRDPLGDLNLDEQDFAWLTRSLMRVAEQCCNGRIVSSLEGGYDLTALADSVLAHVQALAGD